MSLAQAQQTVNDDRVRVTLWTFHSHGDSTGHHIHEFDYVVVPVTGGRFAVGTAEGSTREMSQTAGISYTGTAGTAHHVTNISGRPAAFVEIEIK